MAVSSKVNFPRISALKLNSEVELSHDKLSCDFFKSWAMI